MDPRYEREPLGAAAAYGTGLINQELLLKNEYLAAENRIFRAHLPARLRLSDPERSTLAEIGKRLPSATNDYKCAADAVWLGTATAAYGLVSGLDLRHAAESSQSA